MELTATLKGESFKLSLLGDRVGDCLLGCLHRLLIGEHLVDVGGVRLGLYRGLVRRRHLSIAQHAPVHITEEGMTHYVGGVSLRGAETLALVSVE